MKILKAVLFLASLNASANVVATPSFSELGDVPVGRSAMTMIQFFNTSSVPIQFFNVSCSGDLSVYSCFTSCYALPAFGSCTVQVRFIPRNGDGARKTVWVNGHGGGWYTTATVNGTDVPAPH